MIDAELRSELSAIERDMVVNAWVNVLHAWGRHHDSDAPDESKREKTQSLTSLAVSLRNWADAVDMQAELNV